MNDTGRKSDVYCAWSPVSLLHEVLLTEELLDFMELKIDRGNKVGRFNSDAVIHFGDTPLCCEMDMGTEGYTQIESQMEAYERAGIYNVWFGTSPARVNGLMRAATSFSLFSVCGSRVWMNSAAEPVSVDQILSLMSPAGA